MIPRVFVDADSCAKRVRQWLFARAKKNQIELIFAANRDLSPDQAADNSEQAQNFKMIVCPAQSQAADNWILANAAAGDIAVTRDIPLASALLEKQVTAMNDFGKIFDKKNIERALKERELSLQMAELGLGTKKRDSYGQKEFELFEKSFSELIRRKNC